MHLNVKKVVTVAILMQSAPTLLDHTAVTAEMASMVTVSVAMTLMSVLKELPLAQTWQVVSILLAAISATAMKVTMGMQSITAKMLMNVKSTYMIAMAILTASTRMVRSIVCVVTVSLGMELHVQMRWSVPQKATTAQCMHFVPTH